jgi:ricin-type beta-trefoil lectin protein/PAN domain-containing protein
MEGSMRAWLNWSTAAFILALVTLMPGSAPAATLRMVIQLHPDAGGRCMDVPWGEFARGMRVQLWDCNYFGSQVFTYDDQSEQLSIGRTCVEAWGRGDANDAIGLWNCHGRPNQHWKMVQRGDYYQITTPNGLCLDARYGGKAQNGNPLQIAPCGGGANQLWALTEAQPTFEKGDVAGNTITEYDMSAPDPKLCQKDCIDNAQCAGWVYRAPEGRTNHAPHCWLRNNLVGVRTERWDGLTYSGVR